MVLDEPLPRYLFLDGVRGLAAVAVLFWHYQHFFMLPGQSGVTDFARREPLHRIFGLLYDHGVLAVPLFWIISGFVFAAVYGGGRETTRGFFFNRLARLYPLHLLTLLIVAGLQGLVIRRFGASLFYGFNDSKHFVLNLFFASAWRFGMWDQSFNGPVWSVSIEVLIYAVFWTAHHWLLRWGVLFPFAISAIFLLLMGFAEPRVLFQCGWLFFFGCAIFITHRAFHEHPALVWPLVFAIVLVGAGLHKAWSEGIPFAMGGVVLAVATLDSLSFAKPKKLLSFIGDSTYGLYLWHVPIQLALSLIVSAPDRMAILARSPLWLAAFLLISLTIARLSFIFFERPMRLYIRKLAEVREPDASIAAP